MFKVVHPFRTEGPKSKTCAIPHRSVIEIYRFTIKFVRSAIKSYRSAICYKNRLVCL